MDLNVETQKRKEVHSRSHNQLQTSFKPHAFSLRSRQSLRLSIRLQEESGVMPVLAHSKFDVSISQTGLGLPP